MTDPTPDYGAILRAAAKKIVLAIRAGEVPRVRLEF